MGNNKKINNINKIYRNITESFNKVHLKNGDNGKRIQCFYSEYKKKPSLFFEIYCKSVGIDHEGLIDSTCFNFTKEHNKKFKKNGIPLEGKLFIEKLEEMSKARVFDSP